jgi:pimeloyl-ACP methyl ester carboxylesterase
VPSHLLTDSGFITTKGEGRLSSCCMDLGSTGWGRSEISNEFFRYWRSDRKCSARYLGEHHLYQSPSRRKARSGPGTVGRRCPRHSSGHARLWGVRQTARPSRVWGFSDVVALIEHLRLVAVDVIGFSMGAGTAARLLILRPPQVKSAILAAIGGLRHRRHNSGASAKLAGSRLGALPADTSGVGGGGSADSGEGRNRARAPWLPSSYCSSCHGSRPESVGNRHSGCGRTCAACRTAPVDRSASAGAQREGRCSDAANQKVGRLLKAIPPSSTAECEGDHHSTPFEPAFHRTVIRYFQEQWRSRHMALEEPCPALVTDALRDCERTFESPESNRNTSYKRVQRACHDRSHGQATASRVIPQQSHRARNKVGHQENWGQNARGVEDQTIGRNETGVSIA